LQNSYIKNYKILFVNVIDFIEIIILKILKKGINLKVFQMCYIWKSIKKSYIFNKAIMNAYVMII